MVPVWCPILIQGEREMKLERNRKQETFVRTEKVLSSWLLKVDELAQFSVYHPSSEEKRRSSYCNEFVLEPSLLLAPDGDAGNTKPVPLWCRDAGVLCGGFAGFELFYPSQKHFSRTWKPISARTPQVRFAFRKRSMSRYEWNV